MTNTIRISLICVDNSIHTFITELWRQLQNISLPARLWLNSGRIWQTFSQSKYYLIAETITVLLMCRQYYISILLLNSGRIWQTFSQIKVLTELCKQLQNVRLPVIGYPYIYWIVETITVYQFIYWIPSE